MGVQSYLLFALPISKPFLLFVFFGTLCSYSFHWYLTPEVKRPSIKVQWTLQHKPLLLFLFVTGLLGSGYFIVQLAQHWFWLLITAFITFLYSAPKLPMVPFNHIKRFAIGKTIFLALVWMFVTAALPLVTAQVQWQPAHYFYTLNRFFLIYPICILFDYRDREGDKKEGIRTMITFLDERGIHALFWSSLVVYFISTLALFYYSFSVIILLILLLPGILLSFLFPMARKSSSDLLYYFMLDGLMALSSFLLLPLLL